MKKIPCKVCGKEINCYPSTINHKIFCSNKCKETITHLNAKCLYCGKDIHVAKSRYFKMGIKYRFCNNVCYQFYKDNENAKRINKHTHVCTNCNKIFISTRQNKTEMVFCSQKCSKQYMRGNKSPFYKGHTIMSNGYKAIYIDRKKYILEHRFMMEQYLGRKLKSKEIVHHKDGNKLNNNIENLQLMDKIEHDRMHTLRRHKSGIRFGRIKGGIAQNSCTV